MEKRYAQKNEHALEDILARKKTLTYHETITLPLRRLASVGFLAPHVLSRRLYTPPRFTFPLRLFAQWHATLDPQRISSSLWQSLRQPRAAVPPLRRQQRTGQRPHPNSAPRMRCRPRPQRLSSSLWQSLRQLRSSASPLMRQQRPRRRAHPQPRRRRQWKRGSL